MKKYMTIAVICGCLLIGSLYPKLLLDHNVRLIGADGREIVKEIVYSKEIPVKIEFRFLRFFR